MTAIALPRDSFDLGSELRVRALDERPVLPLVVSPPGPGTRDAAWLARWIHERRGALDRALVHHGALLFRGFTIASPEQFEAVASAYEPDLGSDYLGTSPRNRVSGRVFTASELPPFYPIPQHLEMSFLARPPRNLFFYAHRPNIGPGGETPLADFRAVWRDLDPRVRRRFEQRGVRHVRNYVGPATRSRRDLWKLKRWDEVFGSTDRDVVAAKCKEQGLDHTWVEGDRLRLSNVQPAFRLHPDTGEPVWFNHAQVFHLSAAAGELARVARRPGSLVGRARAAALAAFAAGVVALKRKTARPEEQAMHATFGDGGEIPDADMDAVRDAIWRNLVVFRWQEGDVVFIDNASVSHGRLPHDREAREILVAWGPTFGQTRADRER